MKNKKNNSLLNKQKLNKPNLRSVEEGQEDEVPPQVGTGTIADGTGTPSTTPNGTQWPETSLFMETTPRAPTTGLPTSNAIDYIVSDANDEITAEITVVTCNANKTCDPYRVILSSNTFLTPVVRWENIDPVDGHKPLFPSITEGMENWTSEERKSGTDKADCFIIESKDHPEILNVGKYEFDSTYVPFAEVSKMFTNMGIYPNKPFKFKIVINVQAIDSQNNVITKGPTERLPISDTDPELPEIGAGQQPPQGPTVPDEPKPSPRPLETKGFDSTARETPWDTKINAYGYSVSDPVDGKITQEGSTTFTTLDDVIYINVKMVTYNENSQCTPYDVKVVSPLYLTPNIQWENFDHVEGHADIFPGYSKKEGDSWVDEQLTTGNGKADYILISSKDHEDMLKPGIHYFDTTYIPLSDLEKVFDFEHDITHPSYKLSVVVTVEAKNPSDLPTDVQLGVQPPVRVPTKPTEVPPPVQLPEDTQKPGQGETVTPPVEDNTQQPTDPNPDQGETTPKPEEPSTPSQPVEPTPPTGDQGQQKPDDEQKPSKPESKPEEDNEPTVIPPFEPPTGLPPYQEPTGNPGSNTDGDNDSNMVHIFNVTPHTPLEMSVGTPIIIQITKHDNEPLTNLNIQSKEGHVIVTQEHDDKTLYTISSHLPVKTTLDITANGYMPVSVPIEFLDVSFTATLTKESVREKEPFEININGVRDTDRIDVRSSIEGFTFTVKSNQLVEVVYDKNDISKGEVKEGTIDVIVGGVKVSNNIKVKPEIDILDITFTPSKEAYITDEMILTISGTEEDVTVSTASTNIVLTQVENEKYKYKITAERPTYAKISIAGNHVKFESVQVTFRDKKQLQVIPHTPLAVSIDQAIVLEVISRSGEDIENIILKPKSGKVTVKKLNIQGHGNLYEIRATDKSVSFTDTLEIKSATDNTVDAIEQQIAFSLLNISIKQDQEYFRARKLNTLTITGLNDTDNVEASCDLEDVTINRSKHDVFEIVLNKSLGRFETVKTVINFTVNGHKYGQPVEFLPEFDSLAFNFFPDRKVKYTSEITVEVQGAKGKVNLKTDHNAITIKRIGEEPNRFLIDSTTVTEAIITAYGTDIETKAFSVDFVANDDLLPMQTEYEITRVTSTQGNFSIRIKNVIGQGLSMKSNSFKVKPLDIVYRTDNVAIANFQLSDFIESPVNTSVNFYRDGKLVLEAPVEIRLPKPKEPFGCDKLSLQGYVTSTEKPNGISVSIPFLNKEKDFVCRGENEEFNKKIVISQMANRLVIKADKPCKGSIILKHPDYIDSHIYVDFVEYKSNGPTIIEDKDGLIQEAESLGLGYKNDLYLRYDPDEFIVKVCSLRNITDKEKVGYIYVNGSVANRTSIRFYTSYEKNNAPTGTFHGPDAVARDNFNLYSVIKKILFISDYYSFREEFMLVIQMFKTYQESSLNLLRIYRFEERWKGSPQELEKYKLMTTFISKYIEQHGKDMNQYVKPLRNNFPSFIVDNLDKFTNEELYV